MSTGYTIKLGYMSDGDKNAAGEKLVAVVKDICAHPNSLRFEAMRVEGVKIPAEYADSYREPWKDATIKIVPGENGDPMVFQMASGGGAERGYKEAMRRAFCRLVIEAMHKAGMEVNLTVA